ncbi:hypothetical protein BKA70DRAFT_1247532 [Coprinopsis sp. MPI-PUGE-AT-0042]|nr:hypothetical protein BKA70DRAFT_1247532 [Coprinopsis sp. MPI-PUGE-AT-0042]
MAGQSSHGEHRHRSDRERERSSSSHHHNRTISSTTLLLVLSLVLAVLAVMLSLPGGTTGASGAAGAAAGAGADGAGMLGFITPKRSQAIIARESAIAVREADVARREAEILVGAPGGVIPPGTPIAACPPCQQAAATVYETVYPPAQTVIKEIVKEDSLTPPGWTAPRIEDIIERELKIAEREREIGRREEQVNKREHDASRRENWIMEQLYALGNDQPQTVEEEYIYDPVPPPPVHRKAAKQIQYQELPPHVVDEYVHGAPLRPVPVQTQIISGPAPASTRPAPFPTPEAASHTATESSPRTTAVEIIREEVPAPAPLPPLRKPVLRGPPPIRAPVRPPAGW